MPVHRGRHSPPGRHKPLGRRPPPRDGHCSRRYASYWNAFLLKYFFSSSKRIAIAIIQLITDVIITVLSHWKIRKAKMKSLRSVSVNATLEFLKSYSLAMPFSQLLFTAVNNTLGSFHNA